MNAPLWPFALDRSHPLAQGLVGAFIARSGATTCVDLHANRNITPNITSGDLTPWGRLGGIGAYGLRFSGDPTRDRVKLGNVPATDPLALAGKTTVSILAWIQPEAASNFPRIIDKSTGGTAANGWALYLQTNALRPIFQVDSGNMHTVTVDMLTMGETVLLGYTMNGLNSGSWYRDGALFQTDSATLSAIPSAAADCAIGNWNHNSDRMLDGSIYSVMVYDRALSAEEHAAAYDPASRWAFLDTYGRRTYFLPATGGAHTITPSGGLSLGGTTDILTSRAFLAAGGLTFGGAPAILKTHLIDPGGGVQLGGTAPFKRVHTITPAGGLQLGGVAAFTTHDGAHTITPAGGLLFDGTAPFYAPSADVFTPIHEVVRDVVRRVVHRPDRDDDGSGDWQD